MNDELISDWKDTIGLTIGIVEEYLYDKSDEQIEYTLVRFTNGKFIIQKDQSGFGPTTSGLAQQRNYLLMLDDIKNSIRVS